MNELSEAAWVRIERLLQSTEDESTSRKTLERVKSLFGWKNEIVWSLCKSSSIEYLIWWSRVFGIFQQIIWFLQSQSSYEAFRLFSWKIIYYIFFLGKSINFFLLNHRKLLHTCMVSKLLSKICILYSSNFGRKERWGIPQGSKIIFQGQIKTDHWIFSSQNARNWFSWSNLPTSELMKIEQLSIFHMRNFLFVSIFGFQFPLNFHFFHILFAMLAWIFTILFGPKFNLLTFTLIVDSSLVTSMWMNEWSRRGRKEKNWTRREEHNTRMRMKQEKSHFPSRNIF